MSALPVFAQTGPQAAAVGTIIYVYQFMQLRWGVEMMRRQRSIVVLLFVMLSTAGHAFAQSAYDPPPAPPRKTPTSVPASLGGVQRLQALGFGDNGESGTYTYDGSGNITAIGSDTFLYDAEGRLVTAVIRGVTGTYTYDAFGNRKTATGETNCYGQTVCATPLTLDSTTNHLLTTTNGTTTNVGYDAAGNIISASGGNYTYDGTGMMTEATVGSDDRQFVYTADDERIAVRQGQSWTWTVRGLDNKVLREFTSTEPNNSTGLPAAGGAWIKDYIWRDGLLLASTDTTGTFHYHLDHLGTPRLITNASGVKIAEHAYYPFGAEISLTPHESTEEALKFTGHERDSVVGDGHTLDDMHARYYNASLGRFLEADPIVDVEKNVSNPQRWNRHVYAENSPVNAIDPNGKETYRINRTIGGYTARSPLNPLTHTFIATTSGGVIQTYSWGNTPDQFTKNGWNQDKPEDLIAAQQALKGGLATKVGDDTLDPYIKAAFDSLKDDPMSNHWNLGLILNCKFEASVLIKMAEQARRENEAKQSKPQQPGASPGQPKQPDDPKQKEGLNKTSFAPCALHGDCPVVQR